MKPYRLGRFKLGYELGWLLFLLPALIFYLCFSLFPMLSSAYYSFTDWNGVTSKFIGMDNYAEMFADRMILTAFWNTAQFTVTITVLQNLFGLLLALLLVRRFAGVNFMRSMFFLPSIFSTLLIGYVWSFMLEPNIGVVNNLLASLHLERLQVGWLSDPFWAKWVISLVTTWQFMGYSMVIYIAGLQSINQELYEYGQLEGAIGFKKFIQITFPLVAPAFTINIVLSLIGNLQIFNQIYVLTGGGPGYRTESVASMIYHLGFGSGGSGRWGYGSAMSIVLFLFILLLTTVSVTLLRRREVEL